MKFMVLIYNDPALLAALPAPQFDATMRGCLEHADDLRKDGRLLDSQMLESPSTAKSLRNRQNRLTITDGPFTESKECWPASTSSKPKTWTRQSGSPLSSPGRALGASRFVPCVTLRPCVSESAQVDDSAAARGIPAHRRIMAVAAHYWAGSRI